MIPDVIDVAPAHVLEVCVFWWHIYDALLAATVNSLKTPNPWPNSLLYKSPHGIARRRVPSMNSLDKAVSMKAVSRNCFSSICR